MKKKSQSIDKNQSRVANGCSIAKKEICNQRREIIMSGPPFPRKRRKRKPKHVAGRSTCSTSWLKNTSVRGRTNGDIDHVFLSEEGKAKVLKY